MKKNGHDFLTEKQVAHRLDVCLRKVQEMRRDGIGPPFTCLPKSTHPRYAPADVDEWEKTWKRGGKPTATPDEIQQLVLRVQDLETKTKESTIEELEAAFDAARAKWPSVFEHVQEAHDGMSLDDELSRKKWKKKRNEDLAASFVDLVLRESLVDRPQPHLKIDSEGFAFLNDLVGGKPFKIFLFSSETDAEMNERVLRLLSSGPASMDDLVRHFNPDATKAEATLITEDWNLAYVRLIRDGDLWKPIKEGAHKVNKSGD
jgi:hypothetical protein